jgi:hypothetical protein
MQVRKAGLFSMRLPKVVSEPSQTETHAPIRFTAKGTFQPEEARGSIRQTLAGT